MCLAMPKPRILSEPKTLAIFLSGMKYCLLSGSWNESRIQYQCYFVQLDQNLEWWGKSRDEDIRSGRICQIQRFRPLGAKIEWNWSLKEAKLPAGCSSWCRPREASWARRGTPPSCRRCRRARGWASWVRRVLLQAWCRFELESVGWKASNLDGGKNEIERMGSLGRRIITTNLIMEKLQAKSSLMSDF